MINGLEGIPGSGKSYEATVYHVLESLRQGRLVVTNLPLVVEEFEAIDPSYRRLIELRKRPKPIRGTWDANRLDDKGNGKAFELFADGHIEAPMRHARVRGNPVDVSGPVEAEEFPIFGHVWDYYHEWRHPDDGRGPLFVIDECHNLIPQAGTPQEVVQFYKLHRHFNVDILLMTQSFRDVNQPIARLMHNMIRTRKADFLGKADHYIRKVFAGYRGALTSTEERKYRPEMFRLYKSHTQGRSVAELGASDFVPFIVKWKKFTRTFIAVSLALSLGFLYWTITRDKPAAKQLSQAKPQVVQGRAVAPAAPASAPTTAASAPVKTAEAQAEAEVEPLSGKGLHLRGRLTLGPRTTYLFVASQNGQPVQQFTDAELLAAGYVFRPMGDCVGIISYKGKERPVSCDLPVIQIQGTGAG